MTQTTNNQSSVSDVVDLDYRYIRVYRYCDDLIISTKLLNTLIGVVNSNGVFTKNTDTITEWEREEIEMIINKLRKNEERKN